MDVDFIPPSLVIEQIRSVIPSLSDMVAGAAQFEAIEDIQKFPAPSCFVLLADNLSETLSMQTSLLQDVYHGFDILLVLDAADRRKQEAEEISVAFKTMLLYALNGWKPTVSTEEGAPDYTSGSPLIFAGDSFVPADRSRYVRLYKFVQDYRWCSATDGAGEDPGTVGNFDTFLADLLVDNTDKELPIKVEGIYHNP